ncbi:hypothetical protein AX14_005653 [Amanita brunnescens Koide BX004]|nr:hypothetical protein AX14_005653 [Amanita brunnescens Koide BX004]
MHESVRFSIPGHGMQQDRADLRYQDGRQDMAMQVTYTSGVCSSPESGGKLLATTAEDKQIRIWDKGTGSAFSMDTNGSSIR